MSRRKHLLQSLDQAIEAPGKGQHIVRAVGGRGSNIMEVEFPDGRTTLCLLPAKFHKKLWIKNRNFLIVSEDAAEADGRVTGQILAVLFADHVKQLKRMPGVWPQEFDASSSTAAASQAAEQLAALGIVENDSELENGAATVRSSTGAGAPAAAATTTTTSTLSPAAAAVAGGTTAAGNLENAGDAEHSSSSSEDDLPPIPRFHNRKVIEYQVSDSESEDD